MDKARHAHLRGEPSLTNTRVAVLLAVYNGMQYMGEQIYSILAQKNVDLSIFVSIDRSSDGSEAWLETLAKKEPRIILLPFGQRFGSAGKNFFRLIRDVDFSPFGFVAFADQDDWWYEDKLARAIVALGSTSSAGYSSNVLAFWPDNRRQLINKAQTQKKWDFLFEAAGPGCTYVLTVQLIQAIQQQLMKDWDGHLGIALHDWYCYAFARAQGYQWFIDPTPSLLYRQHTNNEMGVNRGPKAAIARLKKIKNGWWLHQSLLIASLVGLQNNAFIKSWQAQGRCDWLRLSKHAFQCRRKLKEQCLFLFICLTLAISGSSHEK